jgi:hypothetical protein
MTESEHRAAGPPTQDASGENRPAGLTRRTVLAGAAATTAALTFISEARAETPPADPDPETFLKLSAALTGIARAMLGPGTDPLHVGSDYFAFVTSQRLPAFPTLLKIARDAKLQIPTDADSGGIIKQADVDALIQAINGGGDDTKYLARSIVLMWYLGAWYEPNELKALAQDPTHFVGYTVISAKAYTQGWLWRIAQAHPMGYSDMQFGYWTRAPEPREYFINARTAGRQREPDHG